MARRTASSTPTEAPAADFDDLLAEEDSSSEEAVSEKSEADSIETLIDEMEQQESTMTPAQMRLAAARAKLAALQESPQDEEPEEEDEYAGLSEEEIAELKAVEDQIAVTTAQKIENATAKFSNSRKGGTGRKILIHVVRDGFTAFGDVWLRGQEIEIEEGTPAYKRTQNVDGVSWLDLRNDPSAQMRKWGHHYIAEGEFVPFPGEKFDDEVARADRRRGRSVPIVANLD